MEPTQHSNKGIVITIVAVVVVGIIGYVSYTGSSPDTASTVSDTQAPVTGTPAGTSPSSGAPADLPSGAPVASASAYKDGTYTAEGTYNSPGGPDGVKVTLVIKNDIVTDAAVVGEAGDRESQRYQNRFISGFKALVVGQKLAGLSLDKVSGSSLTGAGFNAAVAKIQAEAQA